RTKSMAELFILAPFLLLIILNLPFRFLRRGIAFWLVVSLLLIQILFSAIYHWLPANIYPHSLRLFFSFKLSLDALALIILFTIGIVALVALLVARVTMATESRKFNFINLLLISLIGMNATVLVSDIFSLYVFIEVTGFLYLCLWLSRKIDSP
ncbi:MAG: hypothetical protein NTZ48_03605, partial [Candidatus Omnitrophica bacterium]|nr:hypothetical protein [Candidatus Omnitrophota bacterium]